MPDFPSTHASLLFRLRGSRDDPAWTRFVSLYEPAIYTLAKRRGMQDADCRETVQEVLLRVSESLSKFDRSDDPDSGTFRAWLSRVVRNIIIDDFRKRERVDVVAPGSVIHRFIDDQSAAGMGPETPQQALLRQLDQAVRERQFEQAAAQVRRQTREVHWLAFWQTFIEGQSIESVAKRLDLKPGAVYVIRCRILKRIRQCVEAESK